MPNPSLLLLQIAVILALCRLATPVFARLRQPPVIAEMMVGLLLGPSCFGWVAPQLSAWLFPESSLPALNMISQVGLVLFMFLIGWRLDVGHLRTIGHLALVIGLVSIVVPFALGSSVAAVAWYQYAPSDVGPLPLALFMGAAMSITAFPVLVRILDDQRLLGTSIGTLAVACAAFGDAAGWLILAAITAVARSGSVAEAGVPLIGLAAYGVVMIAVVRPLLARVAHRRGATFGAAPADVGVMLIIMVSSAYATDVLGLHALFGAFFAGVTMPRATRAEQVFSSSIEPIVTALLLPLFFAFSGLRTSVQLISGPELWVQALLILAVATVGKGVGSAVAARVVGMSWADASLIGVLLNTRGLVELVVLNIGLDLGILSPVLFSMMVLMALATTLATSPLVSLITARVPRADASSLAMRP
ncbi:MAG: cation:proton antiporter [Vicinamibacterales bacterium]